MRRKTEVVSFRATEDLLRQIDAAREPFQISRGDWTRSIVTTHLHQGDQDVLIHQIEDVRQLVTLLGDQATRTEQNLARALHVLLTTRDELSPDEAKNLIRRKLTLT